ncbi:hypothetical protein TeGR_g1923 [Tetraparma gracilis]|uniref:Uncharacterized protein n=1 Tax=Tetraparma gracilis TaxID=2962635 RepID=A0ABQ6N3D7_9STRA|nr:hypothetical protein TeGR_g1923 [Tetraparma gracilis]
MANLTALNITDAEKLVAYICDWKVDGEDVDYRPVCEYGMVPKGWPEADDITDINDCSLRVVDAFPTYGTASMVYIAATFLVTLWSIRNAYIYRAKRLEAGGKNKDVVSSSELMARCMVFSTSANTFTQIDVEGYHIFPYIFVYSLSYMILASLVSLLVILVRSWVTVIDGGKAKVTPKWVNVVGAASLCAFWSFEIGGGIVEWVMVDSVDGGFNGSVNALRGFAFSLNCLMWVVVCMHYYLKISGMLAKGGASAGAKSIHKLSKSVMISCSLAFAYKGFFGYLRLGTGDNYTPPPCAGGVGFFRLVPVIYMFVTMLMLGSQHPSKPQKSSAGSTVAPSSTE